MFKSQIQDLENECAEYKDLAYQWWRILQVLLELTKRAYPFVYEEYTESYGGKEKFEDWWQPPQMLSEIRKIYSKKE
jgi:hypothetical protein